MTSPPDETVRLDQDIRARPVPWVRRGRPVALPFIVALSLLLHASILVPLLFQMKKSAAAPATETPVEIVQEPEPPAKKPEPKPPQKDGAKEAEDKAAQQKQEQQKQEQAKREQAEQKKARAQAAQKQAAQEQAAKEQQAKAEQAKAAQQAQAQQAQERQAQEQQAREQQQQRAEQAAKAAQGKQAEAQARVAERMRNLLGQPAPSVDAAALPGESADGTVSASYQQLVLSKLTKALSFDRHRGNPGFAVVTFILGDRGEVASVTLDRPSGDPVLDQEAIAVVRRGAPYPAPPPGGKRDYTVTLESRPVM